MFTKALRASLSDEEYRSLQTALLLRPEQGALVRGTGGLRKIRWAGLGHGKRGGYRIIYYYDYYDTARETFYMLYIYPKNAQEDLTPTQERLLARLVREEFK